MSLQMGNIRSNSSCAPRRSFFSTQRSNSSTHSRGRTFGRPGHQPSAPAQNLAFGEHADLRDPRQIAGAFLDALDIVDLG
jgi:hypothetical protein